MVATDDENSNAEDEWTSIISRCTKEGLEWDKLDVKGRTIQVWRWLVDAEANLKASRNINDKLRQHHGEEKKELNDYCDELKRQAKEKIKHLNEEAENLKSDLEALLSGTEAVGAMLLREGLTDLSNASLGEQIAYLLVERSQLLEELRQLKGPLLQDEEGGRTTKTPPEIELAKVTSQRHLLQEELKLLREKFNYSVENILELEETIKKLEEHNDNLSFKLSEALMEIENQERILRARKASQNEESYVSEDERRLEDKAKVWDETPNSKITNKKSEEDVDSQEVFMEDQVHSPDYHPDRFDQLKQLQEENRRIQQTLEMSQEGYEEIVKDYDYYRAENAQQIQTLKKQHEQRLQAVTEEFNQINEQRNIQEQKLKDQEELMKKMKQTLENLQKEKIDLVDRLAESGQFTENAQLDLLKVKEENSLIKQDLDNYRKEKKKWYMDNALS